MTDNNNRSRIVVYKLSDWKMINPLQIDINGDNRISLRVKRNVEKNIRRSWEDIHNIDTVAHYMNHVSIWDDFIKTQQADYLVVLGGNTVLDDAIRKFIESSSPDEWDLLLLNYKVVHSVAAAALPEGFVGVEAFRGLGSYVISLNAVKRLMKWIWPIQIRLDSFICIYRIVYGLKIITPVNSHTGAGQLEFMDGGDLPCALCDIPDNWRKRQIMIKKWDLYFGRMIELGVLLGGLWMFYRKV